VHVRDKKGWVMFAENEDNAADPQRGEQELETKILGAVHVGKAMLTCIAATSNRSLNTGACDKRRNRCYTRAALLPRTEKVKDWRRAARSSVPVAVIIGCWAMPTQA